MNSVLAHLLLFAHISAVVVWTGGALVGTLIGVRIRKSGDGHAMAAFCRAFAQVAGPVFGGSGLLTVVTGGWLASGQGFDFGSTWLTFGSALWLVSFLFGALVVGRAWTQNWKALEAAPGRLEELTGSIKRAVMLTHVDVLIRIVAIALMVWKPS